LKHEEYKSKYYQTLEKLKAFSMHDNLAKQVGTVQNPKKKQISKPKNILSFWILSFLFSWDFRLWILCLLKRKK